MLTTVFFADNHHPTPNPGKTGFLYYLLFCLLSEEKTVAFQVNNEFILFQETGIELVEATYMGAIAIPRGTWALTNSHTGSVKPCRAFLDAMTARNAWIVQTTSPSPLADGWATWNKETPIRYWMDVYPLDELIALG
jgi:hypothetical protein